MLGIIKSICASVFLTGGLGVGANIVDVTLERNGYVPAFQHYTDSAGYYITNGNITRKTGRETLEDYDLLKGDEFIGADYLRHQELKSLEKRKNLNIEYRQRQEAQRIREDSERVLREN